MATDPHHGRATYYRIRKVGHTWRLYHIHRDWLFGDYIHSEMQGTWAWAMWIATGDPAYRQPGWILIPAFGDCGGSTW